MTYSGAMNRSGRFGEPARILAATLQPGWSMRAWQRFVHGNEAMHTGTEPMDNRTFDGFVKLLASAIDRRSVLKGVFGLSAGAIAGRSGADRVLAARRGSSAPPPTPPPGCPSGSSKCGPTCCPDATSMCCDSACCYGYCYGEEQCCPSPREYCAENNTCCPAGEKCCINGYCYDLSKGACCQNFECPNNGKCCEGVCREGPNACCSDSDCPSGDICTENNTCCHATCTPGQCNLDGCGGVCNCPDGYTCLGSGTCAKACDAGSLFCEEHFCGTCWVDADSSSAYCGDTDRGVACSSDGDCPAGQFCTLLDPPSHCVTACHV
jgi:hypothetical protein